MLRSPLAGLLEVKRHRSTSERQPIMGNLRCRLSESPVISLLLITASSQCVKTSRTNFVNPLVPLGMDRPESTLKISGSGCAYSVRLGDLGWSQLRPENECTRGVGWN